MEFDSVLLIAFGGPTRPDEVRPFLATVTRGRPVPAARLEAVAHHYELIGGRSPLTDLTFQQARALEAELRTHPPVLPVFVGMRNWHPFLHETLAEMAAAGHRRAVAVILSAQQTEASWQRYQDSVAAALATLADGGLEVRYAAEWHDHPLFIEAVSARAAAALQQIPEPSHHAAHMIFTAHSVPAAMTTASAYVAQIEHSARLVAQRLGHPGWSIAYQSRSGDPRDRWLEPDIGDALGALAQRGIRDVVVVPIGFVCDHVEILYDLDIEAKDIAEGLGLRFVRAKTVNDHPAFIQMLADVVRRTISDASEPVASAAGTELR